MASSLLVLLDDIATILDDVATMTKVAAKKTAGVLGDDLALNAQQVTGVNADRELPVVWAVALGSLLNKAILVPAALACGYAAMGITAVVLAVARERAGPAAGADWARTTVAFGICQTTVAFGLARLFAVTGESHLAVFAAGLGFSLLALALGLSERRKVAEA